MNARPIHSLFAIVLILALTGCATYTTPGGPVSIPEITEAGIAHVLSGIH